MTDRVAEVLSRTAEKADARSPRGNTSMRAPTTSSGHRARLNCRWRLHCLLWAAWTATTGDARAMLDFGRSGNRIPIYSLTTAMSRRPGQSWFWLRAGDRSGIAAWAYNAGSGLNDGNWHHIVATLTGTSVSVFVDGASQSYGTGPVLVADGNRFAHFVGSTR